MTNTNEFDIWLDGGAPVIQTSVSTEFDIWLDEGAPVIDTSSQPETTSVRRRAFIF